MSAESNRRQRDASVFVHVEVGHGIKRADSVVDLPTDDAANGCGTEGVAGLGLDADAKTIWLACKLSVRQNDRCHADHITLRFIPNLQTPSRQRWPPRSRNEDA